MSEYTEAGKRWVEEMDKHFCGEQRSKRFAAWLVESVAKDRKFAEWMVSAKKESGEMVFGPPERRVARGFIDAVEYAAEIDRLCAHVDTTPDQSDLSRGALYKIYNRMARLERAIKEANAITAKALE